MNIKPFKEKNILVGCITLLCLACFLISSMLFRTDNLSEKYGEEFNHVRYERGIPLIPEDWRFFSSSEKRVWENPVWDRTDRSYGDGGNPLIIHYQKVLVVVDENTFMETDVYLGDAIEIKDDGVVLERVMLTCTYRLDQINIDCSTDIKTRDIVYAGDDIRKAKTILDKWEIPYP